MNIIYQDKNNISKFITMKLISLARIKKNNINIVLSGGKTPQVIFNYIKSINHLYNIEWSKYHFWWSDERYVNIENNRNNYGQAKRILFDHIPIDEKNLHPIEIKSSPNETVNNYITLINHNIPKFNNIPLFDWIWLGVGEDGHISSIFNNDDINNSNWAFITKHPILKDTRITLGINIINHANEIDFIISGENKAKIINDILVNKNNKQYPAQFIKSNNNVTWHIDKKAAIYLK